MSRPAVLFIFTSADKVLDGKDAGWYLPEAAHPYYRLRPHFDIDSASPKGGLAPINKSSVETFKDEESVKFLNSDPEAKKLFSETKKIKDVNAADYVAIFVIGGHGPVIDLPFDKDFANLAQQFYAAKKVRSMSSVDIPLISQPVAAVCHGPAALTSTVKPGSKTSIFSGISVTGFSNAEEALTPYNDFVNILPFSLEDKIVSLGGKFTKADENYGVKVVYDGGVLTGQNPASAGPLGERLKDILLNKA